MFVPVLQNRRGEVEILHLLPGPGCFTQKLQAGFDGRIVPEAVDADPPGEPVPAIVLDKTGEDRLERQAVERVVGLFVAHGWIGRLVGGCCRSGINIWILVGEQGVGVEFCERGDGLSGVVGRLGTL